MGYVKVRLIADDKLYEVEVDEDADAEELAQGLAEKLRLPQDYKYQVNLMGALKVNEGALIELTKRKPTGLFRSLKSVPGE